MKWTSLNGEVTVESDGAGSFQILISEGIECANTTINALDMATLYLALKSMLDDTCTQPSK